MKIRLSLRFAFCILSFCMLTKTQAQRLQQTINEVWEFHLGAESNAPNDEWQTINLPHTWNDKDVIDEQDGYYRGIGWYRKNLHLDSLSIGKRIFLYFEGANQVLELFVNGKSAGIHIGGYTSFCFDITKFLNTPGDNELKIKVDNSPNKNIPPLDADFNFYGGIYRDVWLITTDPVHFDLLNLGSNGIFIETPKVSERKATVNIRGTFLNESTETVALMLENTILDQAGSTVAKESLQFSAQPGTTVNFVQNHIRVNDLKLWSPESPYLYTVETRLINTETGETLDKVKNPLGFRWYSVDAENGFHLNGKPYKLMGTNRHQDYLEQGNALSDEQHWNDLVELKVMGSNFLRISHYPQDPRVLEACDRLGFIASEEIPIVNEITPSQAFADVCQNNFREMIYRDYNHPSILIWNLSNELLLLRNVAIKGMSSSEVADYDQKLLDLIKNLNATAHKEDPTRYTMTVAHGDFQGYENFGLNDITHLVGYNLYYGWYASDMKGFEQFIAEFHNKHPKTPLLITEYGAGADPRIRSLNPQRFDFSVDYENLFHEYYAGVILKTPYIVGSNIWNFADFYAKNRADAVPFVNNKGLVGLDRKPKDSYYLYQAILHKDPILNIASKGWSLRAGTPSNANENFCKQPVEIYSNLDKVELFLNGQSLGIQSITNFKTIFEVSFTKGENLLEAKGIANNKPIQDFAKIEFDLLPFNLNDANASFDKIVVNCGASFYFIDEKDQTCWMPDQAYRSGNWGYLGGDNYKRDNGLLGTPNNILGTGKDPVFQTQRAGMQGYRFDVPDGRYEVTLCFSQIDKKLLENNTFSLFINKQCVLKNLNISAEYGDYRAVSKRFIVDVEKGENLNISFKEAKGKGVINGIIVRKL